MTRNVSMTEKNKITTALSPDLNEILKKNKEQVKKSGQARLVLGKEQHNIAKSALSPHALKVIDGLTKAGFKAYLVGGCIRDLLTGKSPKDFDVSTNATPEQVRRVFSNSRIIGRRFKIVHVVYGKDIIEVTTFRSSKQIPAKRQSDGSGMLVRDNVYGRNIQEDAERRDFTINAIYYDVKKNELLDFHGGLYDLCHGTIDIIGDPAVRYAEDPVRMIRALRFSAKLGFKMSRRTASPIKEMGINLNQVSNARLFEEVNKLFLTGHGLESFKILNRYGVFEILFPGYRNFGNNPIVSEFIEYALASSDERFQQDKRNMPHFLYAVMLWSIFQERVFSLQQSNDSRITPISVRRIAERAFSEVIEEQNQVTAIPMSSYISMKNTWTLQLLLTDISEEDKCAALASKSYFRGAFDFFKLRSRFEPYLTRFVEFWQPYYNESSRQAELSKAKKEEKEQSRFSKKDKAVKARTGRDSSSGFESEDAAEKNDRLARARAWRISMNLEP